MGFADETEEVVFGEDGDAKLVGFFEFGGAHVLSGEDEAGLLGDGTGVFAAVGLDEGFVFIAVFVSSHAPVRGHLVYPRICMRNLVVSIHAPVRGHPNF